MLKALKNWEACGVDRVNFIFNCMELIPQNKVLESLRVFAEEMMPHFQDDSSKAVAQSAVVGTAAQ